MPKASIIMTRLLLSCVLLPIGFSILAWELAWKAVRRA